MKTVTCDKCGQKIKNNDYCSLGSDTDLCLPCHKVYWDVKERAAQDWLKDRNPRAFYNPEIDR